MLGAERGAAAAMLSLLLLASCRHAGTPLATAPPGDSAPPSDAAPPSDSDGVTPAHTDPVTLVIDGWTRSLMVHVPAGAGGGARALVFNLHGSGGTGAQQEAFSAMDAVADREGFIVAYPDAAIALGGGFVWNVPGQPLISGAAVPAGAADDVAFFAQAIVALAQRVSHLPGPTELPTVRTTVADKAIHIEPLPLQMSKAPAATLAHISKDISTGGAPPEVVAERELAARHDRVVARAARRGDAGRHRDLETRETSGTSSTAVTAGSSTRDLEKPGGASCDPPFELDEQGRKHFKPECWSRPGAASPVRAVTDANCDPSYTLDEQGRKHFKPECFTNAKR